MSQWINVIGLRPEPVPTTGPQGIKIDLLASPYDIPMAIRGGYEATTASFVIDFQYLNDEPLVERPHDSRVWLRLGRHSNRIYRLGIKCEPEFGRVDLRIKALLREIASPDVAPARMNAAAVERVLSDRSIQAQLTPA